MLRRPFAVPGPESPCTSTSTERSRSRSRAETDASGEGTSETCTVGLIFGTPHFFFLRFLCSLAGMLCVCVQRAREEKEQSDFTQRDATVTRRRSCRSSCRWTEGSCEGDACLGPDAQIYLCEQQRRRRKKSQKSPLGLWVRRRTQV